MFVVDCAGAGAIDVNVAVVAAADKPLPPARNVATRSNPARRDMRSARSASKAVVDESDAVEEWCAWW